MKHTIHWWTKIKHNYNKNSLRYANAQQKNVIIASLELNHCNKKVRTQLQHNKGHVTMADQNET